MIRNKMWIKENQQLNCINYIILTLNWMAFLLELQEHLSQSEKTQQSNSQKYMHQKQQKQLGSFIRNLQMGSISPAIEIQLGNQKSVNYLYSIQLDKQTEILFRFEMNKKQVIIKLLHNHSYKIIRSNQIFKNLSKIIRQINTVANNNFVFLIVDSQTGQIILKVPSNTKMIYTFENVRQFLKTAIAESMIFLKAFYGIVLYTVNAITKSEFQTKLDPEIKQRFYGKKEERNNLQQIYSLFPLVNCPLQTGNSFQIQSINCGVIMDAYNKQNHYPLGLQSVSFYCSFIPNNSSVQKLTFNQQSILKLLHYPLLKQNGKKSFNYNTITLSGYDRKRERFVSQGGKARIIMLPSKFQYFQSMDAFTNPVGKSDKIQDSTGDSVQMNQTATQKEVIEIPLIVKIPKLTKDEKERKIMSDRINYEKQILTNLRTESSIYFPKYYHSTQPDFYYRNYLMMDYIPGNTLSEQLEYRKYTMSHSTKLNLLVHISNALRLLQSKHIAHLDLSPNNIIVTKDLFLKIIDFGQAYCPITETKNAKKTEKNKFVYCPGRTFPYSPPQTSLRNTRFNSQQDMYSLGVLIYKLFFGNNPFNCSNQTIEKWYIQKSYMNKIFMVPQQCGRYGRQDYMAIILNLAMKLMDVDEKKRPYPIWAHLIIKKIFFLLQ